MGHNCCGCDHRDECGEPTVEEAGKCKECGCDPCECEESEEAGENKEKAE